MSKVTRRELLRFGALTAAGMLAACAPKVVEQKPAEQPTAAPTKAAEVKQEATAKPVQQQIELRVGKFAGEAWNTDVVFSQKFEEANPNIKVKVEDVDYMEMSKKCLALAATGLLWDVFAGHSRWNAFLGYKGVLGVLDDFVETHDIDFDDFFPSVIADARAMGDGKLMWFPTCVHPAAIAMIAWNKNILDEAGVTLSEKAMQGDWKIDEYEQILVDVCKPHELFGLNLGLLAPHGIAWLSRSWGSDPDKGSEDAWPLSRDGRKNQISDEFPRVKASFEWYHNLVVKGYAPTTAESQAVTGTSLFVAGKQVSQPVGVSGPIITNAQVGDKFPLVYTPWPKGPDGHLGTCLSYNSLATYSQSKYPEEAISLAAFLTGPEPSLYAGTEAPLHAYGRHSAWFSPKLWAIPGGEVGLPMAARMFEKGVDPFPMPWNLRFVELTDKMAQTMGDYDQGKMDWDEMINIAAPAMQEVIDMERP